MFQCTRLETGKIMNGEISGIVRKYDTCPYQVGDKITFTSKYLDNTSRNIPFAQATIISIRPGTVSEIKKNKGVLSMAGYANGSVMMGFLSQLYGGGGIRDSDQAYFLKFRIDNIDKQAGLRGDVNANRGVEDDHGITTVMNEE